MPAIADPQLARLVVVWSPHRREASSGFLVAPDRVLTALHGIRRDDEQFEDCQVTALGENGSKRTTVQARVLWPPTGDREAAKHDVAVLELAESLSVDGEYEVKLARFGGVEGRPYEARALGFPYAATQDPGAGDFVPFALPGQIDSAARWPDRLQLLYRGDHPAERLKGWSGASGGPIFVIDPADGSQCLVGILGWEPPGFGDRARGTDLTGTRISASLDDERFGNALRSRAIRVIGDPVSVLAQEIAEVTIWAIEEFEKLRGAKIPELITDETWRQAAAKAPRVDKRQTDQAGALDQITHAIVERAPQLVGLGGASGVGKSAVMRRAAHSAASRFLKAQASPGPAAPPILPLIINLGRVVDVGERDASIGSVILRWWIAYANKLRADYYRRHGRGTPSKEITYDDVVKLRRSYDIVAILDSADEFLAHHARFDEEDLAQWISRVGGDPMDGAPPFSQIIIARRSTEVFGGSIAQTCQKEIYLRRLSEEQAARLVPDDLWATLTSSLGGEARDLLRTPLIATLLRDYGGQLHNILAAAPRLQRIFGPHQGDQSVAPPGALIEFAFRCYLWWDDPGAKAADIPPLTDAAASVALILFLNDRKEMTNDQLMQASKRYLFISSENMQRGIAQLCHRGILHRRLSDEDEEVIGFSHQVWQDFCLSKIIADQLYERNPKILAERGHYYSVWRDVGYFLTVRDFTCDRAFVADAFATKDQFVYGNVVVVLSYSPVAIDGEALDEIGRSLPHMTRLPVHAIISSLGSRVLVKYPADPSVPVLREAVIRWCKYVAKENRFPFLTRHLAGLLDAELSQKKKPSVGPAPTPAKLFKDVLLLAHAIERGQEQTRIKRRSLEYGYLNVISHSFDQPARTLTAAHYAVMTAACCISTPGRAETDAELKRLLDRRSDLIAGAKDFFSEFTWRRIEHLLHVAAEALEAGAVPNKKKPTGRGPRSR